MKIVELSHDHPTLEEVIGLAKEELVVLRQPNGSVFALSEVDDADVEAQLLRNHPEFMALLREWSQEKPAISLEDLRRELNA